MSTSRLTTSCGVLGAGLGALSGAISGAAGAAMFSATGHAQHFVPMSASIGAAGGALLFGVSGYCSGFFNVKNVSVKSRECVAIIASYTVGQLVSGMIGYGLLYKAGASDIPFGAVVADLAAGAPVTAIPLTVGLLYCVGITTMRCNVGIGATAAVTEAAHSPEKQDDIKQKRDDIPTIVLTHSPIQQGVETAPFVVINLNDDGTANNEDTAKFAIKPAGLTM